MPITKTINFLPTVFQSETNKKFLNATLDQLVTEPNLVPINGYIGRKLAPGFKGIGTYVKEPTASRADYQLEPSVIVKNQTTQEVEFSTSYPEILQKIAYYGGKTDNQDNLWSTDFYSYNPRINDDAFINFGQYYWLPNGPDPVQVFAGATELDKIFYVYPDNGVEVYNVSGYGVAPNPDIVLARGGSYKFNVKQLGKNFWIQTDPGLSGHSPKTNQSTRQILGVTNNGTDSGTVTFNVPQKTAQDFFIEMPTVQTVDLVTDVAYSDLQGKFLSDIYQNFNGIDGQRTNLNGKFMLFGVHRSDDASWTSNNVTVPTSQRYGIWKIVLTPSGSDYIFNVVYYLPIPVNNKVLILSGTEYGNTEWYTDPEYNLAVIPVITAPIDTLYYQDGKVAGQVGIIRLVDQTANSINVETDILGKTNYTSPNGVTFTNGLKIQFDSTVLPELYKNNEYYVEGIGTGIRLIPVSNLVISPARSFNSYEPSTSFTGVATAALNLSRDALTISTTDFPDGSSIKLGQFPNSSNSNYVVTQEVAVKYPYRAGQDLPGEHTSLLLSTDVIGVTLPGILINGIYNGSYVPGQNNTKWHFDTNQVLINGQDAYGGQPVDDNKYVYTSGKFITANAWGNIAGFDSNSGGYIDTNTGHSKIVGFAADGYPIYGPFGFANPADPAGGITRMISGYVANSDGLYRPAPKTVTATVDIVNSNIITVSTTAGINPGMRITVNTGGITPSTRWVVDNGLKTTIGLPEFAGTATQIQLNSPVSIPAGASLTFEYLPGAFIEDYTFSSGGTLDQYNGRFCITPDFPNGTYAYFITQTSTGIPVYPYIVGQSFYGSITVDTNTSLTTPDYIVINRASQDLNPWARRNRWFHKSVIEQTSLYNNSSQAYDNSLRAKRPIIEFDPDLQLMNFGSIAKQPIDIFDHTIIRPFLTVEGSSGIYVDGVNLVQGMRIVFGADEDPLTRNKIWVVNFVDVVGASTTDPRVIHLVLATDGETQLNESVSVFNGIENNGKSFWYDGINWRQAQSKTGLNQAPLFDVFDDQGISFSDINTYPVVNNQTRFLGTKIFSYKQGTGQNDTVLGFPLSYRNFNNVGDIQFENDFDTQTFEYGSLGAKVVKKIDSGFLHKNNSDGTTNNLNVWTNVNTPTRQLQDIAYTFDGITNSFRIDAIPNVAKNKPTLYVYVNAKKLKTSDYQIYNVPENCQLVVIDPVKLVQGDRVDILVQSSTISKLGYYQLPDNLNLNAQNKVLNYPTLGEIRNHIGVLAQNQLQFTGNYPGVSNLRDLYVDNQAGTMLQQSAPVSYAGIFLNDDQYSFVNSLLNAQQEYTRFKNKFLNLAGTSNRISNITAPSGVDLILKHINQIKDSTFPWYYSDMVPYGDDKNVIVYSIFDPAQRNYEISSVFSNKRISNKAILVYLNSTQLLYGKDYTFLETGPGVVLLDSLIPNTGDTLTIVEYNNTDGNWIPETPSKLGLYPKFTPEIYVDYTYAKPQKMIRGHDGSLTPSFGDYRDQLLLELERRIYNNIKVDYSEKLVNIYDSIPGKFRNTGYTINEFNGILARIYLQWVGYNDLDYVKNISYHNDSPFTYNYSRSYDKVNGEHLPGSWRACYEYFYDCQTPHLTPWAMLGFSEMPDWWESKYGPAPYTSGNKVMWSDLEQGRILAGPRKGTDARFARPGLMDMIPVDENGQLLAPLGVLTTRFDANTFNRNWNVGQFSPVETAWRNSSEYPFAMQYAMALVHPGKYFAYGIQTNKYRYNPAVDQYNITGTNNRLTQADVDVNGYVDPAGTITRATGYLNWIADHQVIQGVTDKTDLLHYIRDHTIQLSYRMAGFSGKQYLKILAEQNSPDSTNETIIIPDSDYDLTLNKSTPSLNARYSAIIVEKTSTGFKISGYDKSRPYITIIPVVTTGSSDVIRVVDKSVNYYNDYTNFKINIPYGTEFTTLQQVSNFLSGYERFLKSQGFRFDYFDDTLGEIRNWALSVKEFLFWVQQGWSAGSVIVLGPSAAQIQLVNSSASVDGIDNSFYGTKIINQNFKVLDAGDYTVIRDNNQFSLSLTNDTDLLGFVELNLVQYEHILVFNNKTQFNDVIYDPVTGQRQYRLKLVGSKTGGWTGTLAAQGFVYNPPTIDKWKSNEDYLKGDLVEYKNFYYSASKNLPGTPDFNFSDWLPVDKNKIKTGLLNNFARNAQVAETFYNVDRINLESEFDQYSLGLIGYRNRNYLNDLGLDDTSQVKFYQGFIKQKGTRNAVNALGYVDFNNRSGQSLLSEDWGFRVGSYGSTDTNQFVELVLDESYTVNNPTSLEVLSNNAVIYGSLNVDDQGIHKTAKTPWAAPFLLNRTKDSDYSDDIQTAGFVNIEDVDYTVFDLKDIASLNSSINQIGAGSIIWAARDYTQKWNVYRVEDSQCQGIEVRNALNGRIAITTNKNHGLLEDDTISITNADRYAGFYRVESVESLRTFVVAFTGQLQGFSSLAVTAPIYKLVSMRTDRPVDIPSITPAVGWKTGDKVWVNYNNADLDWAVYNKTKPWSLTRTLPKSSLDPNSYYGTAVTLTKNNKFAVGGIPGYNSNIGAITSYVVNFNNELVEDVTLTSGANATVKLGSVLDSGENYVVAGAPESNNSSGYAFVYSRGAFGTISNYQILAPNVNVGAGFGSSISISDDDRWLYIGAPGEDKVYVYGFNNTVPRANTTITSNGIPSSFNLTFNPVSVDTLYVRGIGQTFVPYLDYTLSGSVINFTNPPQAGPLVITQVPGYNLVKTIQGTSGSKFGFSLSTSTEGAQVIIGAPLANITVGSNSYTNSGSITVYNRSIDNYLAANNQVYFGGTAPINVYTRVYVNGIEKHKNVDWIIYAGNWVLFNAAPGQGKLVTVESNIFSPVQTTYPAKPYSNQQFGYSVDLCSYNCSIYVGAPYQSAVNRYNGAVYRYLNQGRVYGSILGDNIAKVTTTTNNGGNGTHNFVGSSYLYLSSVTGLQAGMRILTSYKGITKNAVITGVDVGSSRVSLSSVLSAVVPNGVEITFQQVPYVNSGESIKINNFTVSFAQTSLGYVVDTINQANIPGVRASNQDGYLYLTSDSNVTADKLKILPGLGTALQTLGLEIFPEVEIINNSTNKSYDYFGKKVKINNNSNILIVASDLAATLEQTTFDLSSKATTFDAKSTVFQESVNNSGAVWIYSYLSDNRANIDNPGRFTFIDQLTPTVVGSGLASNDSFGSDISVNDYQLIIGSKGNNALNTNAGKVFQFNNNSHLLGWDVYRAQEPSVDLNGIIKAYVYSENSQTIKYNLDYIDPAKGKILGLAEQEVTFKVDYDPAIYNNATNSLVNFNTNLYWNDQQVGQVWWDLSKVKYMLYEQGSIKYRTTNWGRAFPGSSIDIYEWVESIYPPSQYVANGGDGVPKYADNSAYVTLTYVDPITNIATVRYYFWVKDKTTLSANQFGRSIPTTTIADYIRNPKNSGVKYFAAIKDNSIAIYNIVGDTTGKDTIFHLDYATKINSNVIHSEYALLTEANGKADSIPKNIYNKLIDSASGIDIFGNPVPDPTLPLQNRYGIDIRPRQSMFVNNSNAIRELVTYVNSIFANNIITQGYDLTRLAGGEAIPPANSGAYDLVVADLEELNFINILIRPVGFKVLVRNDSSVNNLWTIYIKDKPSVNWTANTAYKANTVILNADRTYYAVTDFTSGSAFTSEHLSIYVPTNTWFLERVQSYSVGEYWTYTDWYADGFNKTTKPTYTVNTNADLSSLPLKARDTVKILDNGQGKWFTIQVFPNIVNTVAIQDGTIQLKDNLYNLADYGMGFDADNFDSSRFDQNPGIEIREIIQTLKDDIFINSLDQNFLELFFVMIYYALNEQKYVDWVFKTSFINVLQKINGFTQPAIYAKENQDFYKQYIDEVKPYKSTIREYILDYVGGDNFTGYVTDFDVPSYYDPVLKLYRSPSGEFIEDAKALQLPQYKDWLSNYSYTISSIEILDGGSGYTLAPVVTVTGSTIGNDAVARALITNGVVSKIILVYPGTNYITTPVVTITGGNGTGAKAKANLKNDLVRNIKTTMVYDRYTYGTTVLEWKSNTLLNQGSIVAHNGVAYFVNQSYRTGATFNSDNLTVYPVTNFNTANDRIQAYYQPELGQPGKDLGLLQSGINYPGVTIEGPAFSDSGGFDVAAFDATVFDALDIGEDGTYVLSDAVLDAVVTSDFNDSSLGVRPEDIIIDGGAYVYDTFREWAAYTYYDKGDLVRYNNQVYYTLTAFTSSNTFAADKFTIYNMGPYASHAPEELIPGRIYDTLDIKVSTLAVSPLDPTYQLWSQQSGIMVNYITILDPGAGYNPGNTSVRIEGGGQFTQASAQILLDANGSAYGFQMLNSGGGYQTTPTVIVEGANTKPIIAYAVMTTHNAPSSSSPYPLLEYRIFKDMNDNYSYLRLDNSATTALSTDLKITDTVINVNNARILPEPAAAGAEPGVVFINGERITYYQKDNVQNTLSQLRRGTNGTGTSNHQIGGSVVAGDQSQIVLYSDNYTYTPNANVSVTCTDGNVRTLMANVSYIRSNLWYSLGGVVISDETGNILVTEAGYSLGTEAAGGPSSSTATDGRGFFNSGTIQVQFLKQGLS